MVQQNDSKRYHYEDRISFLSGIPLGARPFKKKEKQKRLKNKKTKKQSVVVHLYDGM